MTIDQQFAQFAGYTDDGDFAMCYGLDCIGDFPVEQCRQCRRWQALQESDLAYDQTISLVDPMSEASWGMCPLYVKPNNPPRPRPPIFPENFQGRRFRPRFRQPNHDS
ncbi:MAG: hypothetical protein LIO91_03555 [Bacteroidales bacterium]|nr:hypothetical protein [Bacteroidales bacterium]